MMNEPQWRDIAEYAHQRAETVFGDAEVVTEDDRFDDKRTLDLAYAYQAVADKINALAKALAYLGTPA